MPLVTTNISWEHEEFGRGESITASRLVEDLDLYDALHYVQHVLTLWGYDVKQLQAITSKDTVYRTDI